MQWRKYAVTFNDNWTPMRLFWTQWGMHQWFKGWMRNNGYITLPAHVRAWRRLGTEWVRFKGEPA